MDRRSFLRTTGIAAFFTGLGLRAQRIYARATGKTLYPYVMARASQDHRRVGTLSLEIGDPHEQVRRIVMRDHRGWEETLPTPCGANGCQMALSTAMDRGEVGQIVWEVHYEVIRGGIVVVSDSHHFNTEV